MEIIIGLVIVVVTVLIIRLFGAWMLRIDEVINLQREQTKILRNLSEKITEKINSKK